MIGLSLATAIVSFSPVTATAVAAQAPTPVIVDTPAAPHPKAQVLSIDYQGGVILFDWLNAQGQRVDSGDSIARFTPDGSILTAVQVVTAITNST